MATAYLKATSLKLIFDYGLNEDDKPVFKSRTFLNISKTADAASLQQAAQAIGSISMHPLWSVEKNESYEIDE